MALRTIACEGYKAFSAPTNFDLGRLTVIFGKNNSGKTTLARLPIFLTNALSSSAWYVLNAAGLSFGNSFADLASPEQAHPRIALEVGWGESILGVELQQISSPDSRSRVALIGLQIDGQHFEVDIGDLSSDFDSAITGQLSNQVIGRINSAKEELQGIAATAVHIPSARPHISDVYSMRDPQAWSSAEVPYLLAADRGLAAEVALWMDDALKVQSVAVDSAAFAFRLTATERQTSVNLANAGRGTQAALPVATLLTAIATDKLRVDVVVIEEPEAHLHPSAHGAVADLILRASAKTQVIVETHSENLILRLRRRVAEKALRPSDLVLHYVEADHTVDEVKIDEFGGAPRWPSGVFENDIAEAEAIMEAKLQAISGQG